MKITKKDKASRKRRYRFLGVALAIVLVFNMIPAAAMAINESAEGTVTEPPALADASPDAATDDVYAASDAEENKALAEEAAPVAPEEIQSTHESLAPYNADTIEDAGITPYWASSLALNFHSNYGGPDDLVRHIVPTTTPFALPSGNSLFGRPLDSEYGKFLGWSSSPSQGSVIDIGAAGEKITLSDLDPSISDTIQTNGVYAQWGSNAPQPPAETVTVSFTAGSGGEIRQEGPTVFTMEKGSSWGEAGIAVPTDLIPDLGNIFSHWELDGIPVTPNDTPADEVVVSSRTYTAVFTPIADIDELISIRFEEGENGLLKNNWSPYKGVKGSEWGKIVERVPKAIATYGSVFEGWELNGVPSDPREIPTDEQIFESRTYRAIFKKVEDHSLPVTVRAKDALLEWNGQPQAVTVGGDIVAGSIAEGHTLEALAEGNGLEAGNYSISLSQLQIADEEGRDVSWEYDITTEDGTLTIAKNQDAVQPPTLPEAPGTTAPPALPEVPEAPEPPALPEVPEAPEPPALPEVPEAPEPPALPEVPEAPEPPALPEVPEAPEPPALPEVPEALEPPALPEVPDAPEPPHSGSDLPGSGTGTIPGQTGSQTGNTPPPVSTVTTEAIEVAMPAATEEPIAQSVREVSAADGIKPAAQYGFLNNGLPTEALADEHIPLGEFHANSWALMNLLLTILTGIAAVYIAVRSFKKRRTENANNTGSWLAWIPAAVSVVLLIATQYPSGIMAMTDEWTIWFLIAAIAQAGIALIHHKKKREQPA